MHEKTEIDNQKEIPKHEKLAAAINRIDEINDQLNLLTGRIHGEDQQQLISKSVAIAEENASLLFILQDGPQQIHESIDNAKNKICCLRDLLF